MAKNAEHLAMLRRGVEAEVTMPVVGATRISAYGARHPVEILFDGLARVSPYPEGVEPVPARIPGFAFFPGGLGLWNVTREGPPPEFPRRGVMILGHNFDSFDRFQVQLRTGRTDDQCPTGRVLFRLLDEAAIDRAVCFFTNFFLGLAAGSKNTGTNMGTFPGARDRAFVERCRRFLQLELQLQEPRLLLTLGTHVPRHIAHLSPALQGWSGRSLAEIDTEDGALVGGVEVEGVRFVAACLIHPAQWRLNVARRSFRGLTGEEAERALLRAAWESAGRL